MFLAMMPNFLDFDNMSFLDKMTLIFDIGIKHTNATLRHPAFQKLMNSPDEHFDIIILEIFLNEAMFGLAEHFKAPIIGFSTFGASKWTTDLVGTPSPPSYVPNAMLGFTDKMSFVQRVGNTLVAIFDYLYVDFVYLPKHNKIYKEIFPNSKTSMSNLRKNTSLVLLNQHVSLNYPRPYNPNMIEVGGLHVNRVAKPLPANIKSLLDNATDGVIYFSLGSNIKSTQLPENTRNALLRTFSKLKQQVLWKWEDKSLPGKPNNVFISDWFPQDDILAHPNVRLFITHGGLLSTTEAVYHGVPVIGIPIFGDQHLNMARSESNGFALTVEYKNLTETSFSWALTEMLNNNK